MTDFSQELSVTAVVFVSLIACLLDGVYIPKIKVVKYIPKIKVVKYIPKIKVVKVILATLCVV